MSNEIEIKTKRLTDWLDRNHLDGVLLTLRSNFAWITAGRDNHIPNNSAIGVASILATRDGRRVCLANAIEAPRMKDEELIGTGIQTISFPWWDHAARKKTIADVIDGKHVAADSEMFGLSLAALPADFNELRWSLTPEEIERYRDGGHRAALAVENACRKLKPGMSEHEAAGILDYEIHSAQMNPLVTLVSSGDRLPRFRHPIARPIAMRDEAMLVTCAERSGLISCLTRFVDFSKPSQDKQKRRQAIANIDAAVNCSTTPGRSLGHVFDDLRSAYAANGFADEWQNHHQGGPTGYNTRDLVVTPASGAKVADHQAFAWNPSVMGAKCEDTVLCSSGTIEVLTAHSNDWPSVEGASPQRTLRRAGVLMAFNE